jgi:hypothetical protein
MVILHVGGRCLETARRAVIAITFWAVGEGGLRYKEKSPPQGRRPGLEVTTMLSKNARSSDAAL